MKRIILKNTESELRDKKLVVEKYFKGTLDGVSNQKKDIEPKIASVVGFLNICGFKTVQSCEGHFDTKFKRPGGIRSPFVIIDISKQIIIEEMKLVVKDRPIDVTIYALDTLIMYFNITKHPYWVERLDLIAQYGAYYQFHDVFKTVRTIKKRHKLYARIADRGIAGIELLPQEFLTDDFRGSYVRRTQNQMERFSHYLEYVLLNGLEI